MSVWIVLILAFLVSSFAFFFFFLRVNSNLTWIHCLCTVHHYSRTVYVLKNIKNGSHDTIHAFKNYFATVLSVFSFNNNKFNPNEPQVKEQLDRGNCIRRLGSRHHIHWLSHFFSQEGERTLVNSFFIYKNKKRITWLTEIFKCHGDQDPLPPPIITLIQYRIGILNTTTLSKVKKTPFFSFLFFNLDWFDHKTGWSTKL